MLWLTNFLLVTTYGEVIASNLSTALIFMTILHLNKIYTPQSTYYPSIDFKKVLFNIKPTPGMNSHKLIVCSSYQDL
jgi:hypothetical protein